MTRFLLMKRAAFAGAALTASSAVAQDLTFEALLLEGDNVSGVGAVTRIDNVAINNSGLWLVEVDTDNANSDIDGAVVRDGVLYLQEGQALDAPQGATLDSFDAIVVNNNGDSAWNFFLDGTSGSGDDSGIYFNTMLVIQESNISTAPQFSPGTPYIGFFETKFNDANQVLIMASIDDPAIKSTVDRALVIASLDGSGNLLSEDAPWKEGDILAGQAEPLTDFETGPHQFAFNNVGDVMFIATFATAGNAVYVNDTLIAQEGAASPIGGRNYEFLTRTVALNDAGDFAFKANLDGDTADDEIIVLNDGVFAQEGQTLDAIAPFLITGTGLSSGPIGLDNNGNLLWFGEWDDPNEDINSGLFLNDQLIVQEGVTEIDGVIIDTIAGGQDAFAISGDGSHVIFEGTLADGRDGSFMITIAGAADLTLVGPQPGLAGQRNGWQTQGATPDSRIYFVYGFESGQTAVPGCPDLFVDIASPQIFGSAVANANGDATLITFVPSAASGRTILFQSADPSHCEVSNLVEFTFP